MEERTIEIKSRNNSKIIIGAIPGHFATNHSHVNYYIDMTKVKTQYRMAKEAAKELAKPYLGSVSIDTIICMEGTDTIAAFLAEELGKQNHSSINSGKDIAVITPETDLNNHMIFRDNMQKYIFGKQMLLLISTASTGVTMTRSVNCLKYYSGQLAGVASIFSAIDNYDGIPVNSIFSANDFSGYETMPLEDCSLCKSGQKLDAIVNSFGYSKI